MNVYQKVLLKLHEATGGRETKAVYLKDVVRELGFYPSYSDIFSQMSHDGWITETKRSDEVNITPWGIREAKKLLAGGSVDSRDVERAAKKVKASIKDLNVMSEELIAQTDVEHIDAIKKQIATVESRLKELRGLL